MPAVFVHGNPETTAIWQPLLVELKHLGNDDVVCLSPPGFGAPLPDGFGATLPEYRDWLIDELSVFDAPVDLVGHDLGGVHVLNVVLSRPDLVRSWVSDVLGIYDADYVWHELARRWQTPGVGEADIAHRFGGTVEERVAALAERGMGAAIASRVAEGQNEAMGRAVIAVYRSAAGQGKHRIRYRPRRPEAGTRHPRHRRHHGRYRRATPSIRSPRRHRWSCFKNSGTGGWSRTRSAVPLP